MGRTVDADLVRDVSALAAATALVGASFGAIAVAAGISPWWAVALSIFVFAGAAQFAAVAVIASGG
ncbi:MAG: AzlC family ABC transporter permease, partial [Micromonosporaceae bacterium]